MGLQAGCEGLEYHVDLGSAQQLDLAERLFPLEMSPLVPTNLSEVITVGGKQNPQKPQPTFTTPRPRRRGDRVYVCVVCVTFRGEKLGGALYAYWEC